MLRSRRYPATAAQLRVGQSTVPVSSYRKLEHTALNPADPDSDVDVDEFNTPVNEGWRF